MPALSGQTILVTGSCGLIGRALLPKLQQCGAYTIAFDTAQSAMGKTQDIRNSPTLAHLMPNVTGVIHLAAVSRVVMGEQDPEKCWSVNVDGTQNILRLLAENAPASWMLHASSREIYGHQETPANEDTTPSPINIYARSKIEGEKLVHQARTDGMKTAILRFSSVYGDTQDYEDRVVPAFARAAAYGTQIRIDGANNRFDFTHVTDVADGIVKAVTALVGGEQKLPPIHFVSGVSTSLGDLASLATQIGGNKQTSIVEAPPRAYAVGCFSGNPQRAKDILGWQAQTPLHQGLSQLIADFQDIAEALPEKRRLAH